MALAIAAYSAYQGIQAQNKASDEADQQRGMEEKNLAFNQQRYADAQARRDKEEALFNPIKQRVIGEAMADKPAGWDQESNMINQGYGDVIRRNASANGNSGVNAALSQAASLGKTSTLTGAYANAKERQRQALAGLMGTGMQSAQFMTSDINQTGKEASSSMGQIAQSHGNWAAMYGNAASNAYKQGISGLGTAWSDMGGIEGIKDIFGKGTDANATANVGEVSKIYPYPTTRSGNELMPPNTVNTGPSPSVTNNPYAVGDYTTDSNFVGPRNTGSR